MKNYEFKLIEIFCHLDDFNQLFIKELQKHHLTTGMFYIRFTIDTQ